MNSNIKKYDRKQECYICLEELDGEISESSCGHIYHYKCISEWIKKKGVHRSCVICEKNTEIINIVNFNSSYDKFKNINKKKKKNFFCCGFL